MWYDYKKIFYEDETYEKTVEILDDSLDFELHNKCKIIGDSTFHGTSITEFEIPSSIETIEIEAFEGCENLKVVKFNEGLKKIEKNAFMGCYYLGPNVSLPDSLEELEKGAFAFCGAIKRIDLPAFFITNDRSHGKYATI